MLNRKRLSRLIFIFITAILSQTLAAETGQSYSPYPGILAAKLVAVHSPSSIELSAQTWPGFRRSFSISLQGIDTPDNGPDVKICERKLAEKALSFIKDFLQNAKKIEIHDMTMETSANQNAQADIYTEKGSLSKALLNQGLARSKETASDKPWCQQF